MKRVWVFLTRPVALNRGELIVVLFLAGLLSRALGAM